MVRTRQTSPLAVQNANRKQQAVGGGVTTVSRSRFLLGMFLIFKAIVTLHNDMRLQKRNKRARGSGDEVRRERQRVNYQPERELI